MPDPVSRPPKVLISYSHDSEEHADKVLSFSDRLRAEGVDAIIDQYEPFPEQGWTLWMKQHLRDSDFVLMVCTETYRRRVDDEEEEGVGRGVRWEGRLIRTTLYEDGNANKRFVPVLFTSADGQHIPAEMRDYPRFALDTANGYENLYRHITNQPKIGQVTELPRRERLRDFEPGHFHLPYQRNTFFTGRESILTELCDAFTAEEGGKIQALTGLGGIGKTQTAVEYAYRHRQDYRNVFWARAETEQELRADFAGIAQAL